MSGRVFCRVGIAVLMALLVGCAGNVVAPDPQPRVPPELPSFPDDVDPSPAEENIRRQQDLTQRNLSQTRDVTGVPVLLNTDFRAVEDESLDLRRDGAVRIRLLAPLAPDKPAPGKPAPDTAAPDMTIQ